MRNLTAAKLNIRKKGKFGSTTGDTQLDGQMMTNDIHPNMISALPYFLTDRVLMDVFPIYFVYFSLFIDPWRLLPYCYKYVYRISIN